MTEIKKGDKVQVNGDLVKELIVLGFTEASAKSMRQFENTKQTALDVFEDKNHKGQFYVTIALCCEIPVQCCEKMEA